MDSKKTKFPPSSIDEAERTLMTRLTGSVDRYVVPEEFRGRTLTAWDHLAITCPPPGETTVQSYTQRWGFNRPVYDCFFPPNYSCICFKCQTLATVDIPYFHEIMDRSAIEGSDTEQTTTRTHVEQNITSFGMNSILDTIEHVAHFYTDYVFVPGYSTFDEPPSTPTFSKIKFLAPDSDNEELRRKWVRRMKLTPTKLKF